MEAFARDSQPYFTANRVPLLGLVLGFVDSEGGSHETRFDLSQNGTPFEDIIAAQFLLSTDFFRNGADESRVVKYLAYCDPYSFVCGNPFAETSRQ